MTLVLTGVYASNNLPALAGKSLSSRKAWWGWWRRHRRQRLDSLRSQAIGMMHLLLLILGAILALKGLAVGGLLGKLLGSTGTALSLVGMVISRRYYR